MTHLEVILLLTGAIGYAVGTVLAIATIRSKGRNPLTYARWAAFMAAFMHLAFLILVGVRTGHFPVRSAFEAFIFLSMATSFFTLALDALRKIPVLVIATLPLALMTTLTAVALSLAPAPPGGPNPHVGSVWTSLHVFVALASYVAFALAFVLGILYLIAQRQLKEHALSSMLGFMPALETVSRLNLRAIAFGVALLAGAIFVGYFQAREVYNRDFYRLDAKIILTTLTLAAYVVVLVLSARPAFKGRRTALASVLGFFLVMVTFWASVFWSGFHNFR